MTVILGFFFILCPVALGVFIFLWKRANKQKTQVQLELSALQERFRPVLDAEEEGRRIREDTKIHEDNAKKEAEEIIRAANEFSAEARALEARTKEFEKTIKAMKNTIAGYGDEYIMPARSLLDDLAEEYNFDTAGKELKAARTLTKNMIKQGLAAECDYVEVERKRAAIAFIVDAFNGRVDSVLSRTKHDNYGTLAQEIKDECSLINLNGQAFRNARIRREYLDARLNELKLGTIAFELKERDREEQRQVKERIREEERARREYEKAMKDAAKQEESLRSSMEKAKQAILLAASEQERAKLEAKMQELQEKLTEAEARSQRAKSMAEQTRTGHVYIISNIGSFGENVLKVGMTRRLEPLDRVKELGDASVPFPFDVHAMIYTEDAPKLEADLHGIFSDNRINKVNFRKEFFKIGIKDVKEKLDDLGVKAHFTLKAEALEYRETIAIEAMPETERHKILDKMLKNEKMAEMEIEGVE